MQEFVTVVGDRLDLLAHKYLGNPLDWELFLEVNPTLEKSFFVEEGLRIAIPERKLETFPDILPWRDKEDDPIDPSLPIPIPPTPQPDAGADEFLTGSGWLPPADARILLEIPDYPDIPEPPTLAELGGVPLTTYNAFVATKGVADGFAPLGADSKVPSIHLPTPPVPPTLGDLGGVPLTTYNAFVATKGAAEGIAPLGADGKVPSIHLPTPPVPPTLGDLGGVPLTTYNAFVATKGAAGGLTPLGADSKIPQEFLDLADFFAFTSGVSTVGGSLPGIGTTAVYSGVVGGLPIYYLVNSAAPANSRIKAITIAANGDLEFRHLNNDGTTRTALKHTASGNLLLDLVARPGSGASAPTGAEFVPGGTYYRTDVDGGELTYSKKGVWCRVNNGSPVSAPDPGIVDLVNVQIVNGDKNLRGFTTLGDNVAIKKRRITGTTPATQGSVLNIPINLDSSKITSFSFLVFFSAKGCMPPNYTFMATYEYQIYFDTDLCILRLSASNSSGLLSKPFVLTVDYNA